LIIKKINRRKHLSEKKQHKIICNKYHKNIKQNYKILFNKINDAVFVHLLTPDLQPGKFIEVNEVAYKKLGYLKEELLKLSPFEINHPDDMKKNINAWKKFLKNDHIKFTTNLITKSGKKIPSEITLNLIKIKDKKYVLGMASDITQKVISNKKIKTFDANYKSIFNGMDDSIAIIDIKTKKIIDMNEVALKQLKISKEDIKNFTFEKFATLGPPFSIKEAYSWLEKAIKDGPQMFEWKFMDKDSKLEWFEVKLKKVNINNKEHLLAVGRNINKRKEIEEKLINSFQTNEKILKGIIQIMERLVEKKDLYTVGHQRRTAELSLLIAQEMGLNENRINGVFTAALIHDIGKIFISSDILNKVKPLTKDEYVKIKHHANEGYELLKSLDFPWPLALMIKQHHERVNGSGYPDGLLGDSILLEARIIAVADVVEAITFERPYRKGLGIENALEEIQRNKGVLYDEKVVDACLKIFKSGKYKFVKDK